MRFGTDALLATVLLTASQATSNVILHRSDSLDACGQINQRFKNNNGSAGFQITGELGLECLQSMPFDSERAVRFVKEYRKWLLFQSDLELLKNPPAGYQMPPTDLIGILDNIEKKAADNGYESQYEFDTAIQKMLKSAFDGHLDMQLCSTTIMDFSNNVPLISISSNGTAIPEVYTVKDAKVLQTHKDKVSPVVSINGEDVESYLGKISLSDSSQDYDALYNAVFPSNPYSLDVDGGSAFKQVGLFSESMVWTGAYHTLHFANGTSQVVDTVVNINTWKWKSGKALYETFCIPSDSTAASSKRSVKASTKVNTKIVDKFAPNISKRSMVPAPEGYPKPSSRTSDNSALTFFPEDSPLEDTAVLAIPSFDPKDVERFYNVTRDFVNTAAKKNKKKVIIDLQGNGGGSIAAGWNTFRLFFPDQPLYSANRFRATEGVNFMGEALSRLPVDDLEGSILSWKASVKPDQKEGFDSWADLFGPNEFLGMNSSSLFAVNLTLLSYPDYNDGMPVSGYGEMPLDPKTQYFDAEDIILITDGTCASTCTIFTELMKGQGVRTIAFGGRPQVGPMQGMGGIKGSMVYDIAEFASVFKEAKKLANSSALLSDEDLEKWDKYVPIPLDDWSFTVESARVNIINAFGPDNDHVPRQYIYEAAECRRFFTFDNTLQQETLWQDAANAMFYDGECVEGSTNATGSLYATQTKYSGRQRLLAMILEHTRE
ncbi:hypothetical protein N7478_002970 [Penicillium angulare]|uniref:uncharacterized protein n=1 Tax=Penicillium angulare TaxID=116970 RepID=UPI0025425AEF|nr:uncharacterized protein N7478_002970 [Penicillium angulare]KAJ5287284.1 hypothetical protein N7478_002970 [Penicillium angulare]